MKVSEIMTSPVLTVSSDKSVLHTSNLMARHRIGSLVVIDNGDLVGIITSRDIRAAHPNRIVADAMTPNPYGVQCDAFTWDALRKMEQAGIERLVVLQERAVVGMITREALVTRLAEWNDSMTMLYRSPYIHAIGEELIAQGTPFQLLFIDLTRFGEINKKYGHPFGDDMIRSFARKLKALFGPDDFVCRYAGDEFAVITRRSNAETETLIREVTCPLIVDQVSITADIGWVNRDSEPDFFRLTFRELVSRASLLSTKTKTRRTKIAR